MTYTVAIIGAGPEPDNAVSGESFSMGYRHANAYKGLANCEIVAVADIVRENAAAFADEFDVDDDGVFEDHKVMLETATPDVVSVAVPPSAHAPIVVDCARAGVEAIHCEKPMADTWGASQRMAQECWRRGVQLTFNHQLRFHEVVVRAKELLDDGEIGNLERVELSRATLFDAGTHQVDLANYFVGDVAPEWVIGQVDYSEENVKFGTHNANQALAQWRYENGVYGLATTGAGAGMIDRSNVLIGSDGRIEVDFFDPSPIVRLEREGSVETFEFEWVDPIDDAIAHVVDAIGSGEEPALSARRALNATEIIFATFESSRERGRVDCPLEIDDNPLEAMVESGDLDPRPIDHDG